MTRRHRRDFLLDSGGVTALVATPGLLVAYLDLLERRFEGAPLIPVPVLTEVRSRQRRSDTLLDRLIKAIGAEQDVYAPLTPQAAARAGVIVSSRTKWQYAAHAGGLYSRSRSNGGPLPDRRMKTSSRDVG